MSLLQKTPSSPVSCLATGFYPHRASLVWRKDGEELHEEVDHGEILPNHDGTFQMSVDLKLSSVTPEDWTRYDCVFQLSGVNEDIITRLDKAVIKTNEGKTGIRSVDGEKHIYFTVTVLQLMCLCVLKVLFPCIVLLSVSKRVRLTLNQSKCSPLIFYFLIFDLDYYRSMSIMKHVKQHFQVTIFMFLIISC